MAYNMTTTKGWENVCEQAAIACNAEVSSLFLVDRTDKSRLVQVSGSGYARARIGIAEYELPDTIDSRSCPGLTPWVVKSGNILNVKSYEELTRHPAHRGKYDYLSFKKGAAFQFRSLLAIPIKLQIGNTWQVIGVLKVENKIGMDSFSDNDQLLLNTLCDYIVSHFDDELNFVMPVMDPYIFLNNRVEISVASVLIPNIENEFIQYFKQHPEKMYEMPSRRFEELIAAIFKNHGFDVYLSQCTRDGGFDVRAIRHDKLTGEDIYLIECKRYSAENKVDISVIDRLLGVVNRNDASKGIVATTSTFTKDARIVETANKHILTLADYSTVKLWLEEIDNKS